MSTPGAGPSREAPFKLAVLNSHPIQYFTPLYRALARSSDIDLTVFYCSRQSLEGGFVDRGFGREVVWDVPLLEGYRHVFLPNLRRSSAVKGFWSLINPGIVRELWQRRFDAIVLHGHAHSTNIIALLAAKLVGTAVFMRSDSHLLQKRDWLKRSLRQPVLRLLFSLCDAFLYIGTRNRALYEHYGVKPRRLFFVPFIVDNDFFASRVSARRSIREEFETDYGIRRDAVIVLSASKLVASKRTRDLLDAFALLAGRGVEAKLMIVGDGPEGNSLREHARTIGVQDIVFAGFQNQSSMPRFLAAADVFVLPAENEAWGLVVNEAMSAGLPVVASGEVGAAPDLVLPGETGFTFAAGDVEGLAECLQELITNPDVRARMRRRSASLVSGWSIPVAIGGIREALASVSSRRTQRRYTANWNRNRKGM